MKTTLVLAAFAGALMLQPALATQPSVSKTIFSDADLDGDGYVTLEEFHKDIVRSFHALDHNRDGYITPDEVRSMPDRRRAEMVLKLMMRLDKDGDGKLSFKEVVEARMAFFDRADTDKDEKLSLAEALAYDARLQARLAEGGRKKKM